MTHRQEQFIAIPLDQTQVKRLNLFLQAYREAEIDLPPTKEQENKLNLFIKAYREANGKGETQQLRAMIFNVGLNEVENALFAILNPTDQEQEGDTDHA